MTFFRIADTMYWINQQQLLQSDAPSNTKLWLCKPNNLTACLRQTGEAMQFKRLAEAWQPSILDEQFLLDIQGQVKRREIIHYVTENVYVYAYVSIPEKTYRQYQMHFDAVGDLPIGEHLLFKFPDIIRSAFCYKYIDTSMMPENVKLLGDAQHYWARSSVFDWSGFPLLITEVFNDVLPAFPETENVEVYCL